MPNYGWTEAPVSWQKMYTHICSSSFLLLYLTQMSLERCQRFSRLLLRNKSQRKDFRLGAAAEVLKPPVWSISHIAKKERRPQYSGANATAKVFKIHWEGMDMTSYLISYLYPKNVDICQRQEIDVAIPGRDRKVVTVKCSRELYSYWNFNTSCILLSFFCSHIKNLLE